MRAKNSAMDDVVVPSLDRLAARAIIKLYPTSDLLALTNLDEESSQKLARAIDQLKVNNEMFDRFLDTPTPSKKFSMTVKYTRRLTDNQISIIYGGIRSIIDLKKERQYRIEVYDITEECLWRY